MVQYPGARHLHTLEAMLGSDEPMLAAGATKRPPDKRAVNLRWLLATSVAGMTSLLFMGGVLYAALEGQQKLAIEAVVTEALTETSAGALKTSQIDNEVEAESARKELSITTVSRVGETDFVRTRPFVLVSAPLSLWRTDLIADVPAFNALQLYSATSEEQVELSASDSLYGANVDGEIQVEVRDFPESDFLFHDGMTHSTRDAIRIVHANRELLSLERAQAALLSYADPTQFAANDDQPDESRLPGVTITPENVSSFEKSSGLDAAPVLLEETLADRPGIAIEKAMVDAGISADNAAQILQVIASSIQSNELQPGQVLRAGLLVDPVENSIRPVRISLYEDTKHIVTVAQLDSGRFVPADAPTTGLSYIETTDTVEAQSNGRRATLYESLYQTGFENGVPRSVVSHLIQIFAFDLDFKGRPKADDTIEVLFSADHESESDVEILSASVTIAGNQRRYYRFRTDDGTVDYFDADGKSAKKFLLRKPVSGGRFRSGFGMRRHPIRGTRTMHNGVDWGASRGTPILAAGNGIVAEAQWKGGYGRWIKLRHANGYETGYAHLSRWGKGIKPGRTVRQGQIIGYVGSTGLSTGPHLHYEVIVNKRHVDPMRIRLPRGRTLEGTTLAEFQQERQRIDELLIGEELIAGR